MIENDIRRKLRNLPAGPGVYFMKDSRSQILYVGKAKNLKNRVNSYFTGLSKQTPKTRALVREIDDFDVMLVTTEVEALLLERTLIKHHQPPFNILLRDDKEYPYVRVDFQVDWPRIEIVRRRKDDGATYVGPFSGAGSLRVMIDAAHKIFPMIRCSAYEFKNAKRVCNYYHMKMCMGPCVLSVDKDQYKAMVRDALEFIQGNSAKLEKEVRQRMKDASSRQLYETAAAYRDQLQAMQAMKERQAVILDSSLNADVISLAALYDQVAFNVVVVRSGAVMGGHTFSTAASIDTNAEMLTQFILQYYDGKSPPGEIVLEQDIEHAKELSEVLSQNEKRVHIHAEKTEPWRSLLSMAHRNAEHALEESLRRADRFRTQLEAVRDFLRLPDIPRRMECIDISNLQGTHIVASNVVFIDGKPEKKLYRHYKIQSVQDMPNDFASIEEVTERRVRRGIEERDLPDLLVIDGGKQQLVSALKGAEKIEGGKHLRIISIAKSRADKSQKIGSGGNNPSATYERIFKPGDDTPTPLVPGSPAFRLLTHIRDEAHRFAIQHHRRKRDKAMLHESPLTKIRGVGPVARKKLLTHFGNLEAIAHATIAQIAAAGGLSETTAQKIKDSLAPSSDG